MKLPPKLFLLIAVAALLAPVLRSAEPPPLQRWIYCSQNLAVEKNIDELEKLFDRAARAGYTHVLLADSKFAKLGDVQPSYYSHAERVKKKAVELKLELVPALFSIGYSNDLLWHNPNLIEALPVRDASFVVQNGVANPRANVPLSFPGGDFSDLKKWSWKDDKVAADNGTARVDDPAGGPVRIVQKMQLEPFRHYHISVRVKTKDFTGAPEVRILAGDLSLDHNSLQAKRTQDWQTHHVVFNSLNYKEVNVYFGCWDGKSGSLWWDDATIEEIGLLNVVRRPGAPLVIKTEDGTPLVEGKDFEKVVDPLMGSKPWNGEYDLYHEPPPLRTKLPEGTKLVVSYYHAAVVHNGQAMICPSEPQTIELLRDQARRLHALFAAKGYMMSHDEIRVMNWCDACQKRQLDAGAMLADNVKSCLEILRGVNPGGRIYVWSDMFDPNHNAKKNYFLVRGDLTGSWEGLDKEVIVVPWYFEQCEASMKFFANRGHRQVMAGYYDDAPEKVRQWLDTARHVPGALGVMYTTWKSNFSDLERFGEIITAHQQTK